MGVGPLASPSLSDRFCDPNARHMHGVSEDFSELAQVREQAVSRGTCRICVGFLGGLAESFPAAGGASSMRPSCCNKKKMYCRVLAAPAHDETKPGFPSVESGFAIE